MSKKKDGTYWVVREDQIEAMASAPRLEVLDAARVLGACSIADIAEVTGRKADSLYYHVKKLVEVGLLIPQGERSTARRGERMYVAAGRSIRLPHDTSDPRQEEMRLRAFALLLRLTERDHRAAFENGLAKTNGAKRNIVNARIKGWLNDEELQYVRGLIEEALETLFQTAGDPREGRRLYSLTAFFTPVAPRKREG